jgi:hypothetical protein
MPWPHSWCSLRRYRVLRRSGRRPIDSLKQRPAAEWGKIYTNMESELNKILTRGNASQYAAEYNAATQVSGKRPARSCLVFYNVCLLHIYLSLPSRSVAVATTAHDASQHFVNYTNCTALLTA